MGGHSPSPWTFDHDWQRIPLVIDANGHGVASIEKNFVSGGWVKDLPQRKANACIIAAAPELLAAADSAYRALCHFKFDADKFPEFAEAKLYLRAAISKATGGAER